MSGQLDRRLAIISFYEAYPPASGAASVSYNFAKFISGSSVLVQLGRQDGRFVTADGVEVVTLAGATESRRERLVRLQASSIGWSRKSAGRSPVW